MTREKILEEFGLIMWAIENNKPLKFEVSTEFLKSVIALIKSQEEELEILNSKIFSLSDTNKKLMDSQDVYWKSRVKEFAERLSSEMLEKKYVWPSTHYARGCNAVIDTCIEVAENISKEMGVTDA